MALKLGFDFAGATHKALRTLFQSLAGSLSALQVAEMFTSTDIKNNAFVLVLAIAGPVQAAIIAFFMNLGDAQAVKATAEAVAVEAVSTANVAAAEAAGVPVAEVVAAVETAAAEEVAPDLTVIDEHADLGEGDVGPVITGDEEPSP